MTILKYTLAMLLLGLLPFFAQAQDYYIQKDDAGLNTAPYQDSLEQHAKDLVFAIPEGPLRDAFRVYGFGFYQHSEATDGYPAAFEKMRTQIASETPYYLIFGKQTDKSGVYTRFWVDVKLPDSGNFHCLTNVKRDVLVLNMQGFTNAKYNKSPTDYVFAEMATMDSLKHKILEIIDCCFVNRGGDSCTECLTPEEVLEYLQSKGFDAYAECRIVSPFNMPQQNPLGTFSVPVIDKANLAISTDDGIVPTAFKHLGESFLGDFLKDEGLNAKAIITKNENFCNNVFQNMLDSLGTGKYIWWHIWDNPNVGEVDYFFIRHNFTPNEPAMKPDKEPNKEQESVITTPCNPGWEDSPCYEYDSQGTRSSVFFVFGTGQSQTWAMNYDFVNSIWCNIAGYPTFQPSITENIDFLGKTLAASTSPLPITVNKCFDWTPLNFLFNGVNFRRRAAKNLANYVVKYLPQSERDIVGIPVTLIGYSHGGNVALQAIPLIYEMTGKKVNLITVATPAQAHVFTTWIGRDGKEIKNVITLRHRECPLDESLGYSLGEHYHFWMKGDKTAGYYSYLIEGSVLKYPNARTKNFMLNNSCNPSEDKHGFPYYLDCIKGQIPSMGIQRQKY